MDVLRDNGISWAPHIAASNARGTLIAFATRSSIVLRHASSGAFAGEMRRPGKVVALAFARAPGLQHLFVAAYDDGAWRVFDAETRRLLRSGGGEDKGKARGGGKGRAVDVCFGVDAGNLIFVAREGGVDVFDAARAENLRYVAVEGSVLCVACVEGYAFLVVVAGEDGGAGFVAVFDVRDGRCVWRVARAAAVTGLDVTSWADGCCAVAFVAADGVPGLATICHGVFRETVEVQAGKAAAVTARVSWISREEDGCLVLACSKASGSFCVYRVAVGDKVGVVLEAEVDEGLAHTRQVFAMAALCSGQDRAPRFFTASMDRKICCWKFGDGGIAPEWAVVGCGGSVVSLASRGLRNSGAGLREWLDLPVDDAVNEKERHLLVSGIGDGFLSLDVLGEDEEGRTVSRSVCQFKMPRTASGAATVPSDICFGSVPFVTETGNTDFGGTAAPPCPCIFVVTGDGRTGCVVYGSGTTGQINPKEGAVFSKPLPAAKDLSNSNRLDFSTVREKRYVRRGPRSDPRPTFLLPWRSGKVLTLTRVGTLFEWTASRGAKAVSLQRGSQCGNFSESLSGNVLCASSACPLAGGAVLVVSGSDSGRLVCASIRSDGGSIARKSGAPPIVVSATIGSPATAVDLNAAGSKIAVGTNSGEVTLFSIVEDEFKSAGLVRLWSIVSAQTRLVSCLRFGLSHVKTEKSGSNVRPSNCLFSVSEDGFGRVWECVTGDEIACMKGHAGRVLSCAWRNDGTAFTGGEDCSIREWTVSKLLTKR